MKHLIDASAKREKTPVVLGEDQRQLLALMTEKIEALLKHRVSDRREDAPPQSMVLLHGQGGSGKTEVIDIVRKVARRFLKGERAMASSNSAARVVGGDTIHSACHMHGKMGFTLDRLENGITDDFIDEWADVDLLVIDEISMVSPRLLGALSYRLCCARQQKGADKFLYHQLGNIFGGVPLNILAGDFMQLPPFEGHVRVSLLLRPKNAVDDAGSDTVAMRGYNLFWEGLTDILFLNKTFRFKDFETDPPEDCPVLPRLFEYMREPKGEGMPKDLWEALRSMAVSGVDDPRLREPRIRNGYRMAIVWEAVCRLMQYRSLKEAGEAGQTLMYVQAIDVPAKGTSGLTASDFRKALQVVNMTKTGSRLGMCPLFVGMRVRLTGKIAAKFFIVQDAVGEVVRIVFDEREFASQRSDWRSNVDHADRKRGFTRLRYMPRGVLVAIDGFKRDNGFGEGVVLVRPMKGEWDYVHHEYVHGRRIQRKIKMKRVNFPLAPEKERTVQSAQGLSMDAAMMMLDKPGTMTFEDWWLHVYVMLSRVRTARQILIFGLPPKSLFEMGPPKFIAAGLARLRDMARRQLARIASASIEMGFKDEDRMAEASVPSHQHVDGWKSDASLALGHAIQPCSGTSNSIEAERAAKRDCASAFDSYPSWIEAFDSLVRSVPLDGRLKSRDFWNQAWAEHCFSVPMFRQLPTEPLPEGDLICARPYEADVL